MTPTEINDLIDRHLSGWLGGNAEVPTLRERLAAMIAEAESARDKLWRDGNAVLKHERDAVLEMQNAMLRREIQQQHDENPLNKYPLNK
jgi:hypothetical protein